MEEVIKDVLSLTGQKEVRERVDGYWFEADRLDATALARLMLKYQFRFSTATAVERLDGETDVIYHFINQTLALNIRTATKGQQLLSMANVLPSANWIEREIRDQFAVQFIGHPDPRPLNRPKEMPEGFFRKKIADQLIKEKEGK
jgi:NADH-quinone oxidoreductase subunit C